jgi:hypothetical protein
MGEDITFYLSENHDNHFTLVQIYFLIVVNNVFFKGLEQNNFYGFIY